MIPEVSSATAGTVRWANCYDKCSSWSLRTIRHREGASRLSTLLSFCHSFPHQSLLPRLLRGSYIGVKNTKVLRIRGSDHYVHLEEMGSIISRSGIPLPAFALRSYASTCARSHFLRHLQGKRGADERTRTAYPCSLRVIHQALQGS